MGRRGGYESDRFRITILKIATSRLTDEGHNLSDHVTFIPNWTYGNFRRCFLRLTAGTIENSHRRGGLNMGQ